MPYLPDELVALGTEGMKQIWHEAKLRGRGYVNAPSILEYARKSVGIKDGADASRQAVKWFVSRIIELDGQLKIALQFQTLAGVQSLFGTGQGSGKETRKPDGV